MQFECSEKKITRSLTIFTEYISNETQDFDNMNVYSQKTLSLME